MEGLSIHPNMDIYRVLMIGVTAVGFSVYLFLWRLMFARKRPLPIPISHHQ